jgi:D-3-phosphoglycerate dehydrogenase
MSFKVVMANGAATAMQKFEIERRILDEAGLDFEVVFCENGQEIVEKCADADVIMTAQNKFPAEVIEKLDKCKAIIRTGVGVDVVDVDAATRKGIMVCNQPDYCIAEVSSHAFALMMDLVRQVSFGDASMRRGEWRAKNTYKIRRLSSMTLGVVSYGNMGKNLARYARAFDMEVVAYDPFVPAGVMSAAGIRKVELDELYAVSDVISLHSPLIPATERMINRDSIAKMKDGVIIINVSRGGLIDEADLVDAVKSGKVAAAGLDVFVGEPIKDPNHPLLNCPNIICTPHIAFDSAEASENLHESVATTAITLSKGQMPYNTVNKAALLKK